MAPEQQAHQQSRKNMDQPQRHPRPDTAEDADPQHADEEHWVGVVAEGQQPFRLLPGQQVLAVQVRRRLGADGIATHQPQQQSTAGKARQAEQRRHQPCQVWGDPLPEAQGDQQGGDHQKGEQGRDHGLSAEEQGLRRLDADTGGICQKPDQNAA